MYYFEGFTNSSPSCSRLLPFVSGIKSKTKNNCKIINAAKKTNIGHGLLLNIPFSASRNKGVIKVINAANTQCVLAPNDCPNALTLFGNISEINTQITAPWPTACEAIKSKIKNRRKTELAPEKNA